MLTELLSHCFLPSSSILPPLQIASNSSKTDKNFRAHVFSLNSFFFLRLSLFNSQCSLTSHRALPESSTRWFPKCFIAVTAVCRSPGLFFPLPYFPALRDTSHIFQWCSNILRADQSMGDSNVHDEKGSSGGALPEFKNLRSKSNIRPERSGKLDENQDGRGAPGGWPCRLAHRQLTDTADHCALKESYRLWHIHPTTRAREFSCLIVDMRFSQNILLLVFSVVLAADSEAPVRFRRYYRNASANLNRATRAATARKERIWPEGIIPFVIASNFSG